MLISVAVLGLLASLDPLRPVVFVLVLRAHRLYGVAFLIGWAAALSVLFTAVFFLVGGDASGRPGSGRRAWASVAELALGMLLLVIAARRWRRGDDTIGHELAPAAIVRQLDRLNPVRAGLIGALVQPRTLTAAAALVVARDRSGVISLALGFGLFALASSAVILGIAGCAVSRPLVAEQRLTTIATRIERDGSRLLTVVCAFGGAFLVLHGTIGLLRG